jgi:hypothetical protein
MTQISVLSEDILGVSCDVLLLKYANANRGADLAVANALGLDELKVPKGNYQFFKSAPKIKAKELLVLGVGPLASF